MVTGAPIKRVRLAMRQNNCHAGATTGAFGAGVSQGHDAKWCCYIKSPQGVTSNASRVFDLARQRQDRGTVPLA